jgi:hypothetical protein
MRGLKKAARKIFEQKPRMVTANDKARMQGRVKK